MMCVTSPACRTEFRLTDVIVDDMRTTNRRLRNAAVAAVTAGVALFAVACGSDGGQEAATSTTPTRATPTATAAPVSVPTVAPAPQAPAPTPPGDALTRSLNEALDLVEVWWQKKRGIDITLTALPEGDPGIPPSCRIPDPFTVAAACKNGVVVYRPTPFQEMVFKTDSLYPAFVIMAHEGNHVALVNNMPDLNGEPAADCLAGAWSKSLITDYQDTDRDKVIAAGGLAYDLSPLSPSDKEAGKNNWLTGFNGGMERCGA